MMPRPVYVYSVFMFVKSSHVKPTLNCGFSAVVFYSFDGGFAFYT